MSETNTIGYYTLQALCLRALGRTLEAQEALHKAQATFAPCTGMEPWKLDWYTTYAHEANDGALIQQIEQERKRRHTSAASSSDTDVLRPAVQGALQRSDL